MKSRNVLNRLLAAESELEVDKIIDSVSELKDARNWYSYGGVDNNFGVIANQQSDALDALVEKLVNQIDSLMLKRSYEMGISPTGDKAPSSLNEAAEMFFGVPDGSLANITDQGTRRKLSDFAYVTATGSRRRPTLAIVDRGEGQHPRDFEKTFLSLQASNKLRIPFVQGRFNMGGTGALPFCGRKGYQLILSRRHPDIILEGEENLWGWTLVRRRPPRDNERSPSYVYFKLNEEIPSFEDGPLPLIPEREDPQARDLKGGAYIKMYDYKVTPATIVTADLYRRLNLKLYYLPIPITLQECRDYQSKTKSAHLSGQRNRLEDVRFREDVIVRPDFPLESRIQIKKNEFINVKAWLLKEDIVTSRWTRPSEAICLTVNGQTHATYDRRFFSRQTVQKDYIKNHLMVEVDCSEMSNEVISDIFMASRDRIRNIEETRDLESALEEMFREDEILKKYDKLWRERAFKEQMEETQSTADILKGFMEISPEIASFLSGGNILDIPVGLEVVGDGELEDEDIFEGEKFPTFLSLKSPSSGILEIPKGSRRMVVLQTDVENSYLSRPYKPGTLNVSGATEWVRSSSLRNGRLLLNMEVPPEIPEGEDESLTVCLSSPHAEGEDGVFEVSLSLLALPEKIDNDEDDEEEDLEDEDEDKDKADKLALPNITGIRKPEWPLFDWADFSVASVHTYEGGADIYVNLDNKHLRRTLLSSEYSGREMEIENLFKIGVGLIAFGLKTQVGEDVMEETMDKVMMTIASIWLPTILKLKDVV